MAHEVTLRALLAIFGGWSETRSRVGTVDLDGYKIRESADLAVFWTFAFIHATPID